MLATRIDGDRPTPAQDVEQAIREDSLHVTATAPNGRAWVRVHDLAPRHGYELAARGHATTNDRPLVFRTNGNEVMSLHTNEVRMFGDNLNLRLINISDDEQARFIGRRARIGPSIVQDGDTAVIFRGQGFNTISS